MPATTELDLTGVTCPLTWVRTKLALERLEAGEELAVRLDPGDPRESVPASAREDGHAVVLDGPVVRIVKAGAAS